jgi:hypothetical protein
MNVLNIVGTEAALARLAVHERIGEAGDVAAGLPDAWMHEDGGVEPFDVVPHPDHRRPPCILEILLQLDTERAIIPDGAGPSVDLRALKNEAAPLGERHELVHHVWLCTGGHSSTVGMKSAPLGAAPRIVMRELTTLRTRKVTQVSSSALRRGGGGTGRPSRRATIRSP